MTKKHYAPIDILDWILCISFGFFCLSAILSLTSSIRNENIEILLSSALGWGLISIAYSPIIEKPMPIRIMLTLITIIVIAY